MIPAILPMDPGTNGKGENRRKWERRLQAKECGLTTNAAENPASQTGQEYWGVNLSHSRRTKEGQPEVWSSP